MANATNNTINMKDLANKAVSESDIIAGREKAKLETLASAYPNGLTVIMCELAKAKDKDGTEKEYARLVFSEENTKYVNGGSAFTKVVRAWLSACGSIENVNATLAEQGGVKFTVKTTRLENGNNYTIVTAI